MRDATVDKLRGLAVLLMVLDHGLAFTGWLVGSEAFGWPLRLTVTRAALPLFMFCAGYVRRDRDRSSWRSWGALLLAAVVSEALVQRMPYMGQVDVLVVIACALVAWPVARRWPWLSIAGCLVVVSMFPRVWDGYHPAHVLALMVLGPWALCFGRGDLPLRRLGERLPAWLTWPGRHALGLYVGHLAGLCGVGWVLSVLPVVGWFWVGFVGTVCAMAVAFGVLAGSGFAALCVLCCCVKGA